MILVACDGELCELAAKNYRATDWRDKAGNCESLGGSLAVRRLVIAVCGWLEREAA
jgi:hypothetical protein